MFPSWRGSAVPLNIFCTTTSKQASYEYLTNRVKMHSSFITSAVLALCALQAAASPQHGYKAHHRQPYVPDPEHRNPKWYEPQTGICPPTFETLNAPCDGSANQACSTDHQTVVSCIEVRFVYNVYPTDASCALS